VNGEENFFETMENLELLCYYIIDRTNKENNGLMIKNVFITGGTGGIGESCARLFAKNGYRVFITYKKNEERAKTLCEELGCTAYCVDVCDKAELSKIFETIEKEYNGVDILINNAAVAEQKLFIDIDEDSWRRMIDINLNGVYNAAHGAVSSMIRKKSGVIINVSSIWGVCGASCEVHYSAAKSGVIGFTKALAKELGLSGIRVNCVAPGIIKTEMNSHLTEEDMKEICAEIPLSRAGTAAECAELIYFLASDDASYITGQTIEINGGWHI